jgi:hypothetical protein
MKIAVIFNVLALTGERVLSFFTGLRALIRRSQPKYEPAARSTAAGTGLP